MPHNFVIRYIIPHNLKNRNIYFHIFNKKVVICMKKQNFLKGSLILMVSAAVVKLFGAIFKIPLTNMLGGVGMSYFSCAYSLFMPVYALTVTGLSAAVARMTAQSGAFGMYDNVRRIRRTAMLIFAGLGLVGSIITAAAAKPFCIYVMKIPEASAAVLMIAPTVFFGCITAVERGYYEGLSNMYPTAFSQLTEGIVKVVTGLFLCGYVMENSEAVLRFFPESTDIRAVAAAAGILGVTLSSAGAMLYFGALRLFGRGKFSSSDSTLMSRRNIARELLSTALPTGVSAVVTNLTALIDMATVIGCITYFGSRVHVPEGVLPEEMPHFIYGSFAGIALTVFNLIPSVTNMLGKGILPSVTEAWTAGDRKTLRKRAVQALMTASVIAVPAAFGMWALSEELLGFLFSGQPDEVKVCVNALRYLMPGMVCLCVSFPLFSMLQAIGKAAAPMKIMLWGAGIKLVGNLTLIPFMGADGAAVSTSVCYGIILIISLKIFTHESGISLDFKPFASLLYSGAMCGASAYLTSDILEHSGFGKTSVLFISTVIGGAVYLLMTMLLRESLYSVLSPKIKRDAR